ncbi:MAG: T9SS type A sorting domain-containing protein [Candidatus Kapaibacteriales bacterium]
MFKITKTFTLLLIFLFSFPLLSQPTRVRLIYPNGGEKFRAGSSVDVIWDTVNTYRSRFAFQLGTSPNGPWVTDTRLSNVLDSGQTRGIVRGGWRVPAIKTKTGYIRIVLLNPDGTLNENVSDINDQPFEIEQPEPITPDSILKTPITNRVKLSNSKIYALDGYVFVDSLGILEIEPGTIIIGDTVGQNSALCVNRGGKIYAQGTPEKPIIFTSSAPPGQRRPGDWGGVLICGLAETNHPGGEAALEGGIADNNRVRGWFGGRNNPNNNDNSGVLSYVRIEFGGIAAAPNQELNGLTLGAVGRGTKIDHVMVSYANDDAFEWFGGSVDAKHIIAYRALDDEFDSDNGFSGRIQFGLSIRAADIADVSGSHIFESDNDAEGSWRTPLTSAIYSNITAIGPLKDTSWTPGTGPNKYHRNYTTAVQIRRNSRISLFNSVIIGWPKGVEILSSNSQGAALNDSLQLRNNYFYGVKSQIFYADGSQPRLPNDWLFTPSFENVVDLSSPLKANFKDPFAESGIPVPIPQNNAVYLNSAKFQKTGNVNIDDEFFERVPYCGAFSPVLTERWDLPWAEYDPINAAYSPVSNVENQQNFVENPINLIPNPASSGIIIRINSSTSKTNLKLIDPFGKIIYAFENLELKDSIYDLHLDISNLSNGTYFILYSNNQGFWTEKLYIIK